LSERGKIIVGTSGWNYDHWKGSFYPPELKQKEWLDYYAGRLTTVEINNSFYNLPSEKTFRKWAEMVPPGFIFSIKASRYITHMKKLKDPREPLERFLDRIEVLEERQGPVLFQLPPHWNANPERLEAFLDELSGNIRSTFEFRDRSWWNDRIYGILEERNAAFCIFHLTGEQSPKEVTADFVYIRLHGPADAYEGLYDKETLSGWAGAASAWAASGKDVYIYFDNDQNGYAAMNAMQLREMTER